jgi:OOP family OmpA-OmpF porin
MKTKDARIKIGSISAIIFCASALTHQAAIAEHHNALELGIGGHYSDYNGDGGLSAGSGGIGQIGYRFDNPISLELLHMEADHNIRSAAPTGELEAQQTQLNLLYHFHDGATAEPYLSFGIGKIQLETNTSDIRSNTLNLAAGYKYHFSEHFTFRPELTYRDVSSDGIDNAFGFNLVLSMVLGGDNKPSTLSPVPPKTAPKPTPAPEAQDSDNDGVLDTSDNCPDTPLGDEVDTQGCSKPLVDPNGDTDGDGVKNRADKCPDTAAKLKVDGKGCPKLLKETKTAKLDITFATNSADIQPEHIAEIQTIADFMAAYAGSVVEIQGHTDSLGKADYNKHLSQRRAEAVAKVLVEQMNIAADRVSAVGYGEEKPIADNATAAGREANRRVFGEISVDLERFEQR